MLTATGPAIVVVVLLVTVVLVLATPVVVVAAFVVVVVALVFVVVVELLPHAPALATDHAEGHAQPTPGS